MKVLLTGGTGFIGTHLVRHFAPHHEVVCLARDLGGRDLSPDVTWIEQDLARPLDTEALPDDVDVVVHAAQSKRYREFPEAAGDIFGVNAGSTLALLEYARTTEVDRFVYFSTGGVYGTSLDRLEESAPVRPLNFYITSKYSAELLIDSFRSYFDTVVLRPFFAYGPGQKDMLIARLIRRVMQGEPIAVQGDPGMRTNPIYVEDLVRATEEALHHKGHDVFNVAGDDTVSITELAEAIGRAVGTDVAIEHEPSETHGDLIGDNARMHDVLGVRPQVRLEAGLRRTVDWHRAP